LRDTEWQEKIEKLDIFASQCELCPRMCGVNRLEAEEGFCGAPGEMVISSIFPHHGEEPPISGSNGSGTVFFSYCTLKCCFCQNYQISHEFEGTMFTVKELAAKFLHLQKLGCHNINLVTATHFLPWIIRSLKEAADDGLSIPVVYNCGGYENSSVIAILDGIVDIYLPDMKYGDNLYAGKYSNAPDYVEANLKAIKEMFRQTGPLRIDNDGIAYRGLCIRHLVLPENNSASDRIFEFLKSSFDPHDIYVSLMAQYRPLYKAKKFSEIGKPITVQEYEQVKQMFIDEGFEGFYQELSQMDQSFIIDFKKRKEERLTGDDV
jgi:putative pyruvate formate lyase activating enzyme